MGGEVKVNEPELKKLEDAIFKDLVGFTEDTMSLIQDKTPQGVTGHLAGSFYTQYDRENNVGEIRAGTEYWDYVNDGTDPFNPKLVEVTLPDEVMKKLGKLAKIGRGGGVLEPIFMEWVQKKLKIFDYVEAYKVAWSIYRKIQREGITAQHYVEIATQEMQKESNLYKLSLHSGAEVKPR